MTTAASCDRSIAIIAALARATTLTGDDPIVTAIALDRAERARSEAIARPNADELRRRLRAVVRELIPNRLRLFRNALVRIIDRAPAATLYKMANRIRELVT